MKIQYWKQVNTQTVGTSHIAKNIPCQDSTFSLFKKGVRVLALADGAGSRKLSHIGSEIVVKEISHFLCDHFENLFIQLENQDEHSKNSIEVKKQVINTIQGKLFDYASTHSNIDIDELASTLLFFAYSKNRYILGHVGDGIIGVLKEANQTHEIETVSFPENGQAANITFFVTNQDVMDHLRIQSGFNHHLNGMVLMSDGPEEAFFDVFNGLNSNTVKLFTNFSNITEKKYTEILTNLLKDQISKISDDDLSLNICYLETKEISQNSMDMLKNQLSLIKETQCLYVISKDTYKFDETFMMNEKNTEKLIEIKAGHLT